MGKIVNSTYMTIDGDITNMQDWHFEFWGDEASTAASAIMGAPEALIMGRKTYEGFYPAWSVQSGERGAVFFALKTVVDVLDEGRRAA